MGGGRFEMAQEYPRSACPPTLASSPQSCQYSPPGIRAGPALHPSDPTGPFPKWAPAPNGPLTQLSAECLANWPQRQVTAPVRDPPGCREKKTDQKASKIFGPNVDLTNRSSYMFTSYGKPVDQGFMAVGNLDSPFAAKPVSSSANPTRLQSLGLGK